MATMNRADILLPRVENMTAWATVACDQFTSEPGYWAEAEKLVGEAPSALQLMLPEAWLNTAREQGADARIARAMNDYVNQNKFAVLENSFVYLERTQPDGRVRRGLMAALDLEEYDFAPGNRARVRATEGTVEERLPPRIRIRSGALLEMPHVMVLMDDRDDRVLGSLENVKERMRPVYDFDLMLGGGHIRGWQVSGEQAELTEAALASLEEPALQKEKYGDAVQNGPMTYAVGDGNHSLASAKRWWEQLRESLPVEERKTHPARYALVELCNIHESALDFEPIHRVIFDTDKTSFDAELATHREEWEKPETIGERVAAAESFCRNYVSAHGGHIDYIHGDDTAREMGERPDCCAVLLPPLRKDGLFLSVLTGGALPRKSFSMGHARDKRYYLECRKIR